MTGLTLAFRLLALAALVAILVATIAPIGMRPHFPGGGSSLKTGVEQAAAFAALAAFGTLGFARQSIAVLTAVLMMAIGLEMLQFFEPSRHPRIADVLMKSAGSLFGFLVAMVITSRVKF